MIQIQNVNDFLVLGFIFLPFVVGIFGIIKTIGKAIFGGGGSGSSTGTKTSASPDYTAKIDLMRAEAELARQKFEQQQTIASTKQRNLLMLLGAGAGGLMLFMFMKK